MTDADDPAASADPGDVDDPPPGSGTPDGGRGRRGDLRGARTLGRGELVARLRHVRADRRRLVAVAATALTFAVLLPGLAAPAVTGVGSALAGPDPPVGTVSAAVLAAASAGGYTGAATAIQQNRVGAVGPLVRTSIPPRAVVLGRAGVELFQASLFAVLPAGALLIELWVGAGTPLVPALVAAAVAPAFVAGLFAGRAVGAGARYVGVLARLSTWTKVLALFVASGALFLGTQSLLDGAATGGDVVGVAPFLPGRPVVAYAATVCSPLGTTATPAGAAVAGVVLAVGAGGALAALRVERALLTDPRTDAAGSAREGSAGVPRPLRGVRSAAVAWRYLLRTRRDPRTLGHLFPLAIGALSFAGSVLGNPDFALRAAPGAAVVGGAVLAGASYCPNPLGDERDQLPLLLTSTGSTALFLRGRILAGFALGLPPAVLASVAGGVLRGRPALAAGRIGLAVVLAGAAAGLALGMGTLVPKFETREVMTVERAHPSTVALLVHFAAVAVAGGVGLILLRLTLSERGFGVGAGPALPALAWLAYLAVLAIVGGGGYAYAVRRFDGFTLDDVE